MLTPTLFKDLVASLQKDYKDLTRECMKDPYLAALERIATALEKIANHDR